MSAKGTRRTLSSSPAASVAPRGEDYSSCLGEHVERGELPLAPDEEVRREFQRSVREVRDERTRRRLEESDLLFADTLAGDEQAVAAQIQKVHAEETSPLHYNREDSLRSVVKRKAGNSFG